MIQEKQTIQQNLSLRPAELADETFLETVYAETRRGELAGLNWSREQENSFFKMQFQMQKQAYRMQFPDADYYVVEFDKNSIGRLILWQDEKEIRLVDVALLAEFRNRGIGKILLERLKVEATFDKPLNLRVLKTNPAAKRFYERLGLSVVEDADLHFSMQWRKS